jgi:hypothetical protein
MTIKSKSQKLAKDEYMRRPIKAKEESWKHGNMKQLETDMSQSKTFEWRI